MQREDDRARISKQAEGEAPRVFVQARLHKGPETSRRDFLKAAGALGAGAAAAGLASGCDLFHDEGVKERQCSSSVAIADPHSISAMIPGPEGRLWSIGANGANLFNLADGSLESWVDGILPNFLAFALSRDGRYLAASYDSYANYKIELRDLESGLSLVAYFWAAADSATSWRDEVHSLAFSPDDSTLYAGYRDSRIAAFPIASILANPPGGSTARPTPLWTVQEEETGFSSMALSLDGACVFLGSYMFSQDSEHSSELRALRASDGEVIGRLAGFPEGHRVMVNPVTGELVSLEEGGSVKIIDPEPSNGTLVVTRSFNASFASSDQFRISEDGARLYGVMYGEIQGSNLVFADQVLAWNLETGAQKATTTRPASKLRIECFCLVGDTLALGCDNLQIGNEWASIELYSASELSRASRASLIDPALAAGVYVTECGSAVGSPSCSCDTVCSCDSVCTCDTEGGGGGGGGYYSYWH